MFEKNLHSSTDNQKLKHIKTGKFSMLEGRDRDIHIVFSYWTVSW